MPQQEDNLKVQENVIEIAPSLELDVNDDELVKLINTMVQDSGDLYETMLKVGSDNEKYWQGKQLEDERLRRGAAKIIDNRLFLSGETIIPIMTSRTPEPTIRLKNSKLREELKQTLMNLWEVPTDDDSTSDMQANMEKMSRHWMLYRLGVLKYYYCPEIDDIRTEVVRPSRMRFDKLGRTLDEGRFVAQYVDDTVGGLIEKWPNKEKEIRAASSGMGNDGTKITYIEFWTNEMCVYKFLNIILEKKKNPNFDYGDMATEEGQPAFNLFKKPRKPYLLLSVFNLGKTVYDDTSLFEQGKTLQDGINKKKRNITDNASDNGILVGSGDYIDKKVLESYSGAPDEKMWVKSGEPSRAVTRLAPKTMPAYVYQDLLDDKSEIDNIFGSHSTTRGEKTTQQTLGEAQLLKQGDYGRIDLLSRALDRIAQDWYTAMIHMRLVFWTTPHEIESNDEDGTSIVFDRNKFVDEETGEIFKIRIKVKPGSAMSIDKDARRAEAIQLMTAGLLDPITFFERMDYANPKEMALKLFQWKSNPVSLFPELMAQQQQQAAETAINTPIPAGTPINLPNGAQVTPQ